MATVQVRLVSQSALLMHNGQLADPTNHFAREMKKVTSKRKKTDDDHAAVKKLEYVGSLYWDKKVGPYITSDMIEACVRDGARVNKLGKQVLASVICLTDRAPLQYKGPRDPDALFADENYVDTRGARVGPSRIMRTRPRFNEWALEFALEFDPQGINLDELKSALTEAGKKGLGDFRPKYGRFTVDSIKTI